ncbi:MAG: hypothetical protein R3C15_08185 [Thermoleophilia bacterium]
MRVARLVTVVELRGSAPGEASFSARHHAELADGRQLLLLGDRGWTVGTSDRSDPLAHECEADLAETARVVVGPDEPWVGRTHEQEAALHWAALAASLSERGVAATAEELRRLAHDVETGPRLRARLAGPA